MGGETQKNFKTISQKKNSQIVFKKIENLSPPKNIYHKIIF